MPTGVIFRSVAFTINRLRMLLEEWAVKDPSAVIRRSPSPADQNDGISDGIEAIHISLSTYDKRLIPFCCD
jgi:hypothetical protein